MAETLKQHFVKLAVLALLMITIDRTNAAAATYSPISYPYNWTQVYDTFEMFDWSGDNSVCCGVDPSSPSFQFVWTASNLEVDGLIQFDPACANPIPTDLPSLSISQTNVSGNAFFTTNSLSVVLYQHNNSLGVASSEYPCLWIFSNALSVPTGQIDYTIPMTQTWNYIGADPDIAFTSIVSNSSNLTSKSSTVFQHFLKKIPMLHAGSYTANNYSSESDDRRRIRYSSIYSPLSTKCCLYSDRNYSTTFLHE